MKKILRPVVPMTIRASELGRLSGLVTRQVSVARAQSTSSR